MIVVNNTTTVVCLTLTLNTVRDITPAEIKIMGDSIRTPHIVSKTMTMK